MASNPQAKKRRSISLRLPMSIALTTEPFQSQEGALLKCYVRLWPRVYGLIFLKLSIVEIKTDIFNVYGSSLHNFVDLGYFPLDLIWTMSKIWNIKEKNKKNNGTIWRF